MHWFQDRPLVIATVVHGGRAVLALCAEAPLGAAAADARALLVAGRAAARLSRPAARRAAALGAILHCVAVAVTLEGKLALKM
eukprot:5498933-Prymnesium_polylepis.2